MQQERGAGTPCGQTDLQHFNENGNLRLNCVTRSRAVRQIGSAVHAPQLPLRPGIREGFNAANGTDKVFVNLVRYSRWQTKGS